MWKEFFSSHTGSSEREGGGGVQLWYHCMAFFFLFTSLAHIFNDYGEGGSGDFVQFFTLSFLYPILFSLVGVRKQVCLLFLFFLPLLFLWIYFFLPFRDTLIVFFWNTTIKRCLARVVVAGGGL